MSKNNKLSFLIFMLFISLILQSCSNTETEFSVVGDVVFLKTIIDNEEVYGVNYYAYGNNSLSAASVITPLSKTVQLEPYSTNTYIYYLEADSSDYTTSYPTEGTYTFDITSADGNTLTATDDQELYDIGFAQIDSMSYDSDYDGYYLTWNEVSGADIYVISLYDSDEELVFSSYSIDADAPEYVLLYDYYGSWEDAPEVDETYTMKIKSIRYDSDATSSDYSNNIQEVSYIDFQFIWGEE